MKRIIVETPTSYEAALAGGFAQVRHLVRWSEPQIDPGQPPYRSTVVRTAAAVAVRPRL